VSNFERNILTAENIDDYQQADQQGPDTIPQPIRAALNLREGDELQYQVGGQRIILTKVDHGPGSDDPFRTFGEWYSEADEKACADL